MSKRRSNTIESNSSSEYSESDLEIQEILGTLKTLELDKPLKKNKQSHEYSPSPEKNDLNESLENLNYLVDTLSTEMGIKIKIYDESNITFILSECLTLFNDNYNLMNNPVSKRNLHSSLLNILNKIKSRLDNSNETHINIRNRILDIENHMLSKTQIGGKKKKNKTKRRGKNKRKTVKKRNRK